MEIPINFFLTSKQFLRLKNKKNILGILETHARNIDSQSLKSIIDSREARRLDLADFSRGIPGSNPHARHAMYE